MDTPTASSNSSLYNFVDVLGEEYRAIHFRPEAERTAATPGATPLQDDSQTLNLDALRARMLAKETSALCLSGGGIRSAAFCLGAVQALARSGFLRSFHYLSTVSGGGYLGSMLAAWGYRAGADYSEVEDGLAGKPHVVGSAKPALVDPVTRLRDFTSYLTPRYGLFSVDTWTLFSTYLRNLVLNWFMLVPLFCAIFLVPHMLVAGASHLVTVPAADTALLAADNMLITGVLFSMAAIVAWRGTSSLLGTRATRGRGITVFITLCSIVAGALLCLSGFIIQARGFDHSWTSPLRPFAQYVAEAIAYLVTSLSLDHFNVFREGKEFLRVSAASNPAIRLPFAYALLGILAWAAFRIYQDATEQTREIRSWANLLISFIVAGAATGLALYCWSQVFLGSAGWTAVPRLYWTFGPPLAGLAFGLAEILLIGLVSKQTDDFDREWWARMGARLLIAALLWVALFTIALLLPALLRSLDLSSIRASLPTLGSLVILMGGIIARIAFMREEFSAKNTEPAWTAKPLVEWLLNFAGLAFIILFLCVVALSLDEALNWMNGPPPDTVPPQPISPYAYGHSWIDVCLAVIGVAIVLWIVPRFIHVNRFSLHAMYRERLIRAFLGGTRAERVQPADLDPKWNEDHQYAPRHADTSTGFDRHDNPILWWLEPKRRALIPARRNQPGGPLKCPPFLIINCALNLAGSDRLALQERKASSFTFSPLHAGSTDTGYRSTQHYSGEVGGITLGTALTISGAAVSPNAGQHSSPILTAVLTLFNARLGSWMGNPNNAHASWKQGPTYALQPMIRELLGRTHTKSPWIHLSDGGHFDNLGIYEAVKRGCRYIVAIDASADIDRHYDGLGIAMRKIRVDLDITFELVGNWWIGGTDLGAAGRYCAMYSVQYPRLPAYRKGTLLYIKPGIYPHSGSLLPMDILQFSRVSSTFPHDSTVNQFFTESQFESYRALGEHEMQTVIGTCREDISVLFETASSYIDPRRET